MDFPYYYFFPFLLPVHNNKQEGGTHGFVPINNNHDASYHHSI